MTSQHPFQTTQWGMVISAGQTGSPEAAQALEELCRIYWFPLYAFLRRRGTSPEDAEDLVQGLFLHLLSRPFLDGVSVEKGRFRSFLLACLNHYRTSVHRREHAQARHGGAPLLPLDLPGAEARFQLDRGNELSAEDLYDRQWALSLVAETQRRLADDYAARDRTAIFQALRPFLIQPPAPGAYAPLASALGLSEPAVAMEVRRMRQRFALVFREEVARTLRDPDEIKPEVAHFIRLITH